MLCSKPGRNPLLAGHFHPSGEAWRGHAMAGRAERVRRDWSEAQAERAAMARVS
jgi:hypothetical protein